MGKKLQILVCCHKADSYIRTDEPYLPVQVGKALHPELDLGFQNDNVGDNISEKNACWCELTALYWGWKNLNDVKYLGLCHYRRYFDYDINDNNIDRLLKDHDIVVVKQTNKMWSKFERPRNLMNTTSVEDYFLYMDTMLAMHPEYKKEIISYYYNSRKSYPYTMFITTKEVYDDFCEFIFPVFEEIEKRSKEHGYTRQKRFIAYFGEYSLGLYILCKKLRPKSLPLKFVGQEQIKPNMFKTICKELIRFIYIMVDNMRPSPKDVVVPDAVKVGFKADNIELRALK